MLTKRIKSIFKYSIVTALVLPAFLTPVYAQQGLSKTPNLTADTIIMGPIEEFKQPENYPQDIVDHFQDNMDARSYIVIDQETNRILAQKSGNMPYPIASMSKVISLYLIYQAIDKGKIKLDDEIEVPQKIIDDIVSNPELSNIGLVDGQTYTVKDLIYAIMLHSANDATSALMWHLYGDEHSAVMAMRDLVESWGIKNYRLYTTSGAPNNELPEDWWMIGSNEASENTMSAADIALAAQHLIQDYPTVLEVTSKPTYQFKEGTDLETTLYNPNQLLPGGQYGREEMDGLKSGYTDAAGKNFVATGTENNRRIIAVAMGVFGENLSSYWEIEILLNKLNEYPDLYQNDQLPTNLPSQPVETTEKNDSQPETESNEESANPDEIPNSRNNYITNVMRGLFSIFN